MACSKWVKACFSGSSGVCCAKEKRRQETKDIFKSIAEGVDKAEDATDEAETKASFKERRVMTGHQGYQIEVMRQVNYSYLNTHC